MIELDARPFVFRFEPASRESYAALVVGEAGAILGDAPEAARAVLRAYAADLGLAFQIQDDLLDVTGDATLAGKDLGRDQAAGKATVVGLLGIAGARERLEELRTSANRHLDRLETDAGVLREVFEFVISRAS